MKSGTDQVIHKYEESDLTDLYDRKQVCRLVCESGSFGKQSQKDRKNRRRNEYVCGFAFVILGSYRSLPRSQV